MSFASSLRYYTAVVQRKSTKLCTTFGRLLGWYTIYGFRGLLPTNGILPGAEFTLRPSLALSYIGSVTARHSSSGRQPNCGVVSSRDRAAIPFDTGRSNFLVLDIVWKALTYLSTSCLKITSHLWLAVTLTHMNGYRHFVAEMLPIK